MPIIKRWLTSLKKAKNMAWTSILKHVQNTLTFLTSEYVNVSHFRIDQLATEEEIEQDSDAVVDKLVDAIVEKIKVVREYKKPESKAKTTKTTTKKKTTTEKKATTKKK